MNLLFMWSDSHGPFNNNNYIMKTENQVKLQETIKKKVKKKQDKTNVQRIRKREKETFL